MRHIRRLTLLLLVISFMVTLGGTALASSEVEPQFLVNEACSMAGATGDSTPDGRPVIWKNRDAWGSNDDWKTFSYRHTADFSSFGYGDRYTDRFNYLGVADLDSIDPISGEYYAWAGANERGLGLVQTGGHTLTEDFQTSHGFTPDQDPDGIDNGQLNMLILSRCEHVDEVEQLLRDTNDGGGFNNSTSRYTSSIVIVFDRYANMATFSVCGTDFTRDNVTQEYYQDGNGFYAQLHNDDKDLPNPPDGEYNGYDWRVNFSRVDYDRADGFPFFVDLRTTEVIGGEVVNTDWIPDGIHDWEYSTSAVKRWTRIGIRMDDPHLNDYQFMIQKEVADNGIPDEYTIETLAKNIGVLPADQKPTGWHLNRFVTTFGVVISGSKIGDPYDGKLTALWLAQGEPTVSIFIPLFPFAGDPPDRLDDMYVHTNVKRHMVYDYVDDNSTGYSSGRNVDHYIDCLALAGEEAPNQSKYYGEGGIQYPIFGSEYYVYNKYDQFMTLLRMGGLTDSQLRYKLRCWQEYEACILKDAYIRGIVAGSGGYMMPSCPRCPSE